MFLSLFFALSNPVPGLILPQEHECLPAPEMEDLSDLDTGMVILAADGLTPSSVKWTMEAFLPVTARCLPVGAIGKVKTEITVACTGRVEKVELLEVERLRLSEAECIRETLYFVGFPAHDMPDGHEFEYTFNYSSF